MKSIYTYVGAAILIVSMAACNKGEDASPRSEKIQLLTGVLWGSPTVTHVDGDLSAQYANFVIKFNKKPGNGFEGTYVIANGGYAFSESSGNWTINDDLSAIVLDSGKELTAEISKQSLRLDFTVPDPQGRTNGLSGAFVFKLKAM